MESREEVPMNVNIMYSTEKNESLVLRKSKESCSLFDVKLVERKNPDEKSTKTSCIRIQLDHKRSSDSNSCRMLPTPLTIATNSQKMLKVKTTPEKNHRKRVLRREIKREDEECEGDQEYNRPYHTVRRRRGVGNRNTTYFIFSPLNSKVLSFNSLDDELGSRLKRVKNVPEIIISGLLNRTKSLVGSGRRVGKTGIVQWSDGMQWKMALMHNKDLVQTLENFITIHLPFHQEDLLYLNISLSYLETRKKAQPQRAHLDYFWDALNNRSHQDYPWFAVLPLTQAGMKLHVWPTPGVGKLMHIDYGELVFFRGDVVHAGGLPVDTGLASRCHFYIPKYSSDFDINQGTNWKDPTGRMICHTHFLPYSSFSK